MFEAWTLKRILWSLRKASLPIRARDLVLDVGSGGNPHPAADVLLDRYINPQHRQGAKFVSDRPAVIGDACNMPFKDKAFDFIIAFHVLEHMPDPARFLAELQRVGKAGYIETPNIVFERLIPYDVHLLEIMTIDDRLIIHKKPGPRHDAVLNELDIVTRCARWRRFFYANPELFHVRYFWKDTIKFTILNPQVSSDWFTEPAVETISNDNVLNETPAIDLRSWGTRGLRAWYKLRKPRPVALSDVVACPMCHGDLAISSGHLECQPCCLRYSASHIPDFTRPTVIESICPSTIARDAVVRR